MNDIQDQQTDPTAQVNQLIQGINDNPYEFGLYQQLIDVYRENQMYQEAKEVRQRVQLLYCLPVEMWLEWIEDEKSLMTPEDSPTILLPFYELALKDYRYYKLSRREGYEKVLTIYSLDVNRSTKFWEPYLDFESQQLELMKQKGESQDELNKQIGRIRSIYRRRAILPTMDMLVIWDEYVKWETDQEELQKVQQKYLEAQNRIDIVTNFEERFQNAYADLEDKNDIEQMLDLLSKDLDLLAQDNFNYIMLYFERILSEYTLNQDLWELYIQYTDEKCKKKELKQEIYENSLKNCPQSKEFWLGYLRELEKNEVDSDTIVNSVNQALSSTQFEMTIDFSYDLLKHLCEYQVRSFLTPPGVIPDQSNEIVKLKVDSIRAMYKDSIENLTEQFQGDPLLITYIEKLILSHAEVEAYKIQDKKQVQELMEDYVKQNGYQMMSWANYIKLMRVFPDHEKTVRGLFKRGLQIARDNKVLLAELWIEWEKKFSTIQNIDQCIKHLKKLNLYSQIGKNIRPSQAQYQQQVPEQNQKQKKNDKKGQNQRQDLEYLEKEVRYDAQADQPQKKRQQKEDFKNDQKYERQERQNNDKNREQQQQIEKDEAKQNQKKKKKTLYLNNLSEETEEEDIMSMFAKIVPDVQLLDVRLIRDENNKKKGFAFVDVESSEMAEKSLKLHNYHLKGKALKIHIYKPPSEGEKDALTVYVTNLPYTCNEEKLRDHFKDVGVVDEVRLLRDKDGKLRGYGYIQFQDKKQVDLAVNTLNKSKIDGRTMVVQYSKSNKEVRDHIGYTVLIKNLSYHVNEEELKDYCEQNFGEIKKLTLAKDDRGKSKGLAFVEFVDEQTMNKAIQQKDLPLRNRTGLIMKSVRQITEPKVEVRQQHSEGKGDKKRDAKRERKTLISSIIDEIKNEQKDEVKEQSKAVQSQDKSFDIPDIKIKEGIQTSLIKDNPQQENTIAEEQQTQTKKMSNNDFKKFLLSGGGKK
ncbi:squamous cell carcinoma antigen recognized by t-cells 3 [Stylonychia lemnae]|uniref:Squamous cell carcinoma antigen recognized by t-cells 3 n=1 Tax=Stylonychia lemnae TaxID=5949 RepID=A0A078BBE9_STYLE|nr:squamous cell carcinoma antigen recognized by t-cells 3 [Stylonychia lemnae]|eukprot:CDW90873.1 squamous cell carcinoma antigen recognized by t-cells 3 [Stylonychia lemnae]